MVYQSLEISNGLRVAWPQPNFYFPIKDSLGSITILPAMNRDHSGNLIGGIQTAWFFFILAST